MPSREATHAGSWYSDHEPTLSNQLETWLARVPNQLPGVGQLPVPGARIIIAPHAGYAYSGACAAWAYKALDLSKAKRIFLLGPSHHHHLSTLALPQLTSYSTPLSPDPLPLDTDLITHLLTATINNNSNARFTTMSGPIDAAEHSLELHLPYIHHLLRALYPNTPTKQYPPLVPMMVGSTSPATEAAFGALLAPYLADETNAFIISSDFCHWGMRFGYTYYVPDAPVPAPGLPLSYPKLPIPSPPPSPSSTADADVSESAARKAIDAVSGGGAFKARNKMLNGGAGVPYIHESISACDVACMRAIASGETELFLDVLKKTGNTVCGRHPIGVVMAGLEVVRKEKGQGEGEGGEEGEGGLQKGKFYFVRYERSSDVLAVAGSSVSYVSAFAVM
ncbi:AmmeMemoRadiSam system protein B [Emergomyces pasteurianus Ep9510]|uniref:AmmeMemoRadiSam system protein B n=1 Tax=Emergomyces pasteurianus Ep9510 TaxID=1447872 RepID=A0A1J9PKK7_9EURO|nr:AmmeMemoRadiSam system protein B [Emergomyces pasteurianus Ep9510]